MICGLIINSFENYTVGLNPSTYLYKWTVSRIKQLLDYGGQFLSQSSFDFNISRGKIT